MFRERNRMLASALSAPLVLAAASLSYGSACLYLASWLGGMIVGAMFTNSVHDAALNRLGLLKDAERLAECGYEELDLGGHFFTLAYLKLLPFTALLGAASTLMVFLRLTWPTCALLAACGAACGVLLTAYVHDRELRKLGLLGEAVKRTKK